MGTGSPDCGSRLNHRWPKLTLWETASLTLWVLFPARRCCISAVWTIKVCMVMQPFSFENCGIFFLCVQILILRSICCCLPACCCLFVICFCSFDVLAVAAVVVGIGSLVIVQKVTRNCWDKREKLESMIISVKCKKNQTQCQSTWNTYPKWRNNLPGRLFNFRGLSGGGGGGLNR